MQNISSLNMEGLWIDLDILTDTNLSIQEKFTLAIIKALDKTHGCFASNKYFATLLQVTPKRASDIIQSLVSKKYITSIIEDNYKRIIRVVSKEEQQESINTEQEDNKEGNVIPISSAKQKKKPIIWRGMDLSGWDEAALERMKKRFPEIEALLQGKQIDETQLPKFMSNEELQGATKIILTTPQIHEEPSEWHGINQLVLTK